MPAGVRGKLSREAADATGGAHDQNGLPGERLDRFDDLECGDAGSRQGRGYRAVNTLRYTSQRRVLGYGDVFRVGAGRA